MVALRYHELGKSDQALALYERIRELAKNSASNLLWVADLARTLERPDDAHDIELALLKEHRLHVERIPEVIARVRQSQGAREAMVLADSIVEIVPHVDLLKELTEAAEELKDEPSVARYKKLQGEVEAAQNTLDLEKEDQG